ncbi:MAG: class I SAM-dependent methyltransferase [Chthoniobacteraceae bacterium]
MIRTWSHGVADENMPEAMLVETLERVRRHPWWAARAELALAVLQSEAVAPPACVLDVGCGWGVNLDALENAGYETAGLDVSRQIIDLIDRPGRQLIEADLNQPLPSGHELYAGALLLDVIEHLDDDRGTLCRIAPLVQPGGVLVVSVPALPMLFSDFDHIQGHRRRYVPETLRAAFDGSGFAVQKIFWWGGWMVPVLKRMRRKSVAKVQETPKTYADYLRLPPWPALVLMKCLYAWEHRRALQGKLDTGTSLFAVARRVV